MFPTGHTGVLYKRLARVLGAALVLLTIFMVSRPFFFKLLSFLALGLFILSIAGMFMTFRKVKSVSARALLIVMLMSIACLVVYASLLRVNVSGSLILIMMLTGAFIGIGRSMTTRLYVEDDVVRYQGNIGHLLIWAFIFMLNQLITLFTSRPPRITMTLLFMSTGLILGNNLCLLFRARLARASGK